jgi:vacuolar-type H+-ATPase subunit I/STV1
MDEENIYSLEENESILKPMKKKESKPLYLHLKGAFLTAMAVHESENYNKSDESLLSNENESNNTHGENSKMKDNVQQDDVLAAIEGLSEDLSAIASGSVEQAQQDPETAPEAEEAVEETPAADAPEAEEPVKDEEDKKDEAVEALKKANERIAQLEAELAKDSLTASDAHEQQSTVVPESAEELAPEAVESASSEVAEENKEVEDANAELTSTDSAPEQDASESDNKVQLLEEENKKLKNALHRTLAERVVDTKIATGVEPSESREDLIEEHTKRSASSLADSLRDLAKMPVAKSSKNTIPEMNSEVAVVEGEDNVITLDKQEIEEEVKEDGSPEQLFVDALMGRRKL